MFDFNNIERSCSRFLAGLKSIVLIDPKDLNTQPDWNIVPTVADLDFKPGKTAHTIAIGLHSGKLVSDTDIGQQPGDFFQYRLECFVRSIRGEVDLFRALIMNRRIHVVGTYKDGSQCFVPYMRLSAKGDSGARPGADKPGYSFTGVATLTKPAPIVGGTIDMPGTGTGTGTGFTVHSADVTTSTYDFELPAGSLLVAVDVVGDTYEEVSIGKTAGGDELGGPTPIEADGQMTFDITLRIHVDTTIYLSGLTGNNTVEIWYIEQ